MITNRSAPGIGPSGGAGARGRARRGFAPFPPPLPLFPIQPLLGYIAATVARQRPELFARLGDGSRKRFLIDPTNLPFVLLLKPDPIRPRLLACNRGEDVEHDVRVSGSFLTLLRMIDGQSDSDALFFNRDVTITGDTEAIVALRNALDDMDATLADDVAAAFGPLSRPVRAFFDIASRFASP